MLSKKSFKILSVFVAVVVAFSCSCFTASAVDIPGDLIVDGFRFSSVDVHLVDSSNNLISCDLNISYSKPSSSTFGSGTLYFSLTKKDGTVFPANSDYYLNLTLTVDDVVLLDTSNFIVGGFVFSSYVNRFFVDNGAFSRYVRAYRYNLNQDRRNDANVLLTSDSGYSHVAVDFIKGEAGVAYYWYILGVPLHCVSNQSFLSFFIHDFDFTTLTPEEAASADIIQNQNENTDRILNAGSDVPQPDFDSTNGAIDDTVGQMESIESQYKIDAQGTQTALSQGTSFLSGYDMQMASIQVKNWIEEFSSDNLVITGFLVAAMCLGLCFWVIGRKAGS